MTEALAYFLRTSRKMREGFIREVLVCKNFKVGADGIATQQTEHGHDGRADLTLAADGERKQQLGIEVKRSRQTKFQDGQLQRMGRGFRKKAYLLAPRGVLALKKAELEASGVKEAPWEAVHALAERLSRDPKQQQGAMLKQFADFLKLRGLSKVPIKHHPMKIKSMAEAARLLDEWGEVLHKLKEFLGFPQSARIVWDGPDGSHRTSFFGIYGPGSNPYAGFRIDQNGKVQCYYEEKAPGGTSHKMTAPYPETFRGEKDESLIEIFEDLQERVRKTWRRKRPIKRRSIKTQAKH